MEDAHFHEDQQKELDERLLRRSEAAEYIATTYGVPCSRATLAKLACVSSDGPRFRKAGRYPLYPVAELDAWARRKVGPLMKSTTVFSDNREEAL